MRIDFDYVRRAGRNIRIHGNGFVQIDLLDRPGARVHLFGHPTIPRQVSPTPIHDHRFGFVSMVMTGCLVNVMWDADHGYEPTHEVCTYRPGRGEDTKLEPLGKRVTVFRRYAEVLQPGQSYRVNATELHETFANEPTLTLMEKTHQHDVVPRVLCRLGQEPDNSFDRHAMMAEADLWDVVRDAFDRVPA